MNRPLSLLTTALILTACASGAAQYPPDPPPPLYDGAGAYDPELKTRTIAVAKTLFLRAAPWCPAVKTVSPSLGASFEVCDMVAGIYASPVRNAHIEPQDDAGDKIWLSSALIEAVDDQELAFLMAHEMAHRIAGHDIAAGSTPRLELEADITAQYILARSDFDLNAGERVITRLRIGAGGATQTHPAQGDRLAALSKARVEIEGKKRRGEALSLPRF